VFGPLRGPTRENEKREWMVTSQVVKNLSLPPSEKERRPGGQTGQEGGTAPAVKQVRVLRDWEETICPALAFMEGGEGKKKALDPGKENKPTDIGRTTNAEAELVQRVTAIE